MHTCPGIMSPVVWTVQQRFFCWWRRCRNIAVTGTVQHGTVSTLRNNEKTRSSKSTINLSYRPVECFVSGRRSCDTSCMLRGRGTIIDETRQIDVVSFQKWTSGVYLPESVPFFVRNSRSGLPRPIPIYWRVTEKVAEKPLAAVDTTLRKTVRGVGRTRSIGEKCCFWRWEKVQRCDFFELGTVHAVCLVSTWMAETFL